MRRFNVGLVGDMLDWGLYVVCRHLNRWAQDGFVPLTLLPVVWSLTLRLLPQPHDGPHRNYVRVIPTWIYGAGVLLYLLARLLPLRRASPEFLTLIETTGGLMKASAMCLLVLPVGLSNGWPLVRFGYRTRAVVTERQRDGLVKDNTSDTCGDAFGRAEWLVIGGYIWLVFAAVAEIAPGMSQFF